MLFSHRIADRTLARAATSLLLIGAIAAAPFVGACTLLSGSDSAVQCESDDDCSAFADSVCTPEGVCATRAEAMSTGNTSSASTGSGTDGCTSNSACSEELGEPAICRNVGDECVKLYSKDCKQVIGDHQNDNAEFFAIMMGLTGAFEFAGTATIPYFEVALAEINDTHGGLPGIAGGPKRPLVALLCDAADDAERAAEHVVVDVGINALTTEYTSFVVDMANVTVPNGAFLLSATAGLDQLDSLTNTDLVWSMSPRARDAQPAFVALASASEAEIREGRSLGPDVPLKMALLVSSDLTSKGDNLMTTLQLNGGDATADSDLFKRIDYVRNDADYALIVAELASFQPDIIVAMSGSEAVDEGIFSGVENNWPEGNPKPHWVFEKSAVGTPNTAATFLELGDEFRARARGMELLYFYDTPEHKAYQIRFESATGSPPFPTTDEYYESNYVIAYLMMATRSARPSGAAMAEAIPQLDGSSTEVYVGPNDYTKAGQSLLAGQSVAVRGAMGDYKFNYVEKHLMRSFSVLCVARSDDGVLYVDATGKFGIYDQATGELTGVRPCE